MSTQALYCLTNKLLRLMIPPVLIPTQVSKIIKMHFINFISRYVVIRVKTYNLEMTKNTVEGVKSVKSGFMMVYSHVNKATHRQEMLVA